MWNATWGKKEGGERAHFFACKGSGADSVCPFIWGTRLAGPVEGISSFSAEGRGGRGGVLSFSFVTSGKVPSLGRGCPGLRSRELY